MFNRFTAMTATTAAAFGALALATTVQARQAQIQRTLGGTSADVAAWVEPTDDGGFVVLAAPDAAYSKTRVLKLDSGGGISWARDYLSAWQSELNLEPSEITAAHSGNVTPAGYAFTAMVGSDRACLVRTDGAGTPQWSWLFPPRGGSWFFDLGPSLDELPYAGGGFVVAGREGGEPSLARIGPDGLLGFSVRLRDTSVPTGQSRGGFNDVQAVEAGFGFPAGFIAVGWLGVPPVPGAAPQPHTLVVRTNLAGTIVWAKTYRQSPHDTAWGVDQAANGDYLVSGWTKSAAEGGGTYLMRIKPNGAFIYQKWFLNFSGTRSVEEMPDTSVLLGGTAGSNGGVPQPTTAVLRTDSAGVLLPIGPCLDFRGPLAGSIDRGRCAMPTADGGFVVLGDTSSFPLSTAPDLYLVKCDAALYPHSGCYESTYVPTLSQVILEPVNENFVLDQGDPRQTTTYVSDPAVDTNLWCMDCPENDQCPPGAVQEGEAGTSDINGGCNSQPVPLFSPIACGTTVCGQFWWHPQPPNLRDTDWYLLTIGGGPGYSRQVTISAHADCDVDMYILDATTNCSIVGIEAGTGTCPTVASACLYEGSYWIFISPKFSNAAILPGSSASKYTLQVSCGSCPLPCVGDMNGDGMVDGADLGQLLGGWGIAGGGGPADFNSDGLVDGADLGMLLGGWGGCGG